VDAIANAIADPIRRDIMLLLRERVLSAGEIAARFVVSRPAVSRHLRVLRECGLVVDEVRGRQRLYRLDAKPLEGLEAWLSQLHDPWSQQLDALETEVYRTRREHRGAKSKPRRKSA
jgi:DNA-binding transcriptional ArsR family regulator